MLNLNRVPHGRRALDPVPEIKGFDALTGLAGRTLFMQRAERQWEWSQDQQQPMTMLLVNLDGFGRDEPRKSGIRIDHAMASVASIIAETCRRRSDFAGRVRHNEFAVLLADVDADGAEQIAEEIRASVRAQPSQRRQGEITVSIAGSVGVPSANRFARSMTVEADELLRKIKAKGGDAVRLVQH